METELPELFRRANGAGAGSSVTFHSARMRMQHVTSDELERMNAQIPRATSELADMRPDIVATACLVAIMAQGPGHHSIVEREIRDGLRAANAEVPVVSSAGALLSALKALGANRIAMITPYMPPLTRMVADYIEDAGIEVADAVSLGISDNRAVGALDARDLEHHWKRLDATGCDALILSACVQMPSLAAIDAVEHASGIPTLSAATATAWAILEALRLPAVIPHAGTLLSASRLKAVTSAVGPKPSS